MISPKNYIQYSKVSWHTASVCWQSTSVAKVFGLLTLMFSLLQNEVRTWKLARWQRAKRWVIFHFFLFTHFTLMSPLFAEWSEDLEACQLAKNEKVSNLLIFLYLYKHLLSTRNLLIGVMCVINIFFNLYHALKIDVYTTLILPKYLTEFSHVCINKYVSFVPWLIAWNILMYELIFS